jgi:hypothetical protein
LASINAVHALIVASASLPWQAVPSSACGVGVGGACAQAGTVLIDIRTVATTAGIAHRLTLTVASHNT